MRYCRKCHILYSSFASGCPKCGALTANRASAAPEEADRKTVRRDWLWIAIGIPSLIAVMYLIVYLTKRFL